MFKIQYNNLFVFAGVHILYYDWWMDLTVLLIAFYRAVPSSRLYFSRPKVSPRLWYFTKLCLYYNDL